MIKLVSVINSYESDFILTNFSSLTLFSVPFSQYVSHEISINKFVREGEMAWAYDSMSKSRVSLDAWPITCFTHVSSKART